MIIKGTRFLRKWDGGGGGGDRTVRLRETDIGKKKCCLFLWNRREEKSVDVNTSRPVSLVVGGTVCD